MVEEKKNQAEKKETKSSANVDPHTHKHTPEDKKENEIEQKPDKKKDTKEQKPKKEEAFARGIGLRMSKKHGMYICKFIKGKKIDDAIKELQEVKQYKRVIPFKGEIPHRKGKVMSGRYPINASGIIINMLKALKGNVITNRMDLDKTFISYSVVNWGARPKRRRGAGKRTNIVIKAIEAKGVKQ